mmetsp:Transcript_36633/g.114369  ORF Transcript_36633/g.114369 Transcript_36633/m.114369 type:complete len:91 (+) Transcript_36633:366-638(+)
MAGEEGQRVGDVKLCSYLRRRPVETLRGRTQSVAPPHGWANTCVEAPGVLVREVMVVMVVAVMVMMMVVMVVMMMSDDDDGDGGGDDDDE